MASKKIVAVVGSTGNQGGSVVEAFLAAPGWQVRAITRKPTSDAAQLLAGRGVEVVQADLTDEASLRKAFQGAHAVFVNTDFWATYYPAKAALEEEGKDVVPASDKAFAYETTNGKHAADAAASIPTLERFVYSALSPIAKGTHGKYPRSLHSEAKSWIVEYIEREQPSLNAKTSILYPGVYNNNRMLSPRKVPDSKWNLTVPLKMDTRVPLIDPRVSLGKFVRALVEDEPAGIKLLGYDSYLTVGEIVEAWSKASGQEVEFVPVTTQVMHDKMKVPYELLDAADYLVEFGLTAGIDGIIEPGQLPTKVSTDSYEKWLGKRNWDEVLAA